MLEYQLNTQYSYLSIIYSTNITDPIPYAAMAKAKTFSLIIIIILLSLLAISFPTNSQEFYNTKMSKREMRRERLTRLHFYFHDVLHV
ncbi:hypothetical protein SASPL_129073 [Salvia splendens]|uniref:Dirigent protein n=1 Tax=Salvia splendens TaxID=180675 RepID=A0A8X8XAP1_SALSN|nr:hypothetical protein SASPL_129073 [Salvia splendens]